MMILPRQARDNITEKRTTELIYLTDLLRPTENLRHRRLQHLNGEGRVLPLEIAEPRRLVPRIFLRPEAIDTLPLKPFLLAD